MKCLGYCIAIPCQLVALAASWNHDELKALLFGALALALVAVLERP